MNAAGPTQRLEEFTAFRPIEHPSLSSFSSTDTTSSFEPEEPLSPLAIFRDGENGASGMHLVRRANPIDSMDCSCHEDDIIWTDSHQRVISPFPADDDNESQWREVAVEHVDYSHFFPSGGVMDCDDFSLSSAEGTEDLILADDLTNPESFWESGSHQHLESSFDDSRSPSPAQVSISSDSTAMITRMMTTNNVFPPSPTSTLETHALETNAAKPSLLPC